jgi:hypothetical protein
LRSSMQETKRAMVRTEVAYRVPPTKIGYTHSTWQDERLLRNRLKECKRLLAVTNECSGGLDLLFSSRHNDKAGRPFSLSVLKQFLKNKERMWHEHQMQLIHGIKPVSNPYQCKSVKSVH